MNMLIVNNLNRSGDLPEIEVNIYNEKKREIVYSSTMQFSGTCFLCFRKYNGTVTCSAIGKSPNIDYMDLVNKGVDKATIIGIMKGAITYSICNMIITAKVFDKDIHGEPIHEMVFTDFIYIAPNPFAMKKKDIDKFIEDCYFMIS